jgi:hypothetical protein
MGEGNSKELPPPDTENATFPTTEQSPTNSKLIDAAIKGQVDIVAKLLKKGKKVLNNVFSYFFYCSKSYVLALFSNSIY